MSRRWKSRRWKSRRGAATVEFALCLPVLLALVFACVEFGGVLQLEHTVHLAAFEGARAGLALNATTTDAQQAANSALTALNVKHATVTVTPNPLSYNTSTLTVTVAVKPTDEGWGLWYFNSASQIYATVTLDREIQAVSATGP